MKINAKAFLLAMARAKISVDELSQKADVSKSTIAAIKRGSYATKPNTLGILADVLNVDVTELLES